MVLPPKRHVAAPTEAPAGFLCAGFTGFVRLDKSLVLSEGAPGRETDTDFMFDPYEADRSGSFTGKKSFCVGLEIIE